MKFQKIEFQVLILITTKNHSFLISTILIYLHTKYSTYQAVIQHNQPIIYSPSSSPRETSNYNHPNTHQVFIKLPQSHSRYLSIPLFISRKKRFTSATAP